jgi:hypothetical protein
MPLSLRCSADVIQRLLANPVAVNGRRVPPDMAHSRQHGGWGRLGRDPPDADGEVAMFRFVRIVLLVAMMLAVALPATSIASTSLDADLAALWTKVLETPSAQNAFGTGGQAYACWDLGNSTVAPFGPTGVGSCTVTAGTAIFVAANSVECSTFEGTPKGRLQDCARRSDVQVAPLVTFDRAPVAVTEAETGLLSIVLPADNVFGLPAGTQGFSYGHGWVALLSPPSLGTHKIVITISGRPVITTVIKVRSAG